MVSAIAAAALLPAASATASVPTTTTLAVTAGGSAGMYGAGCPTTLTATVTSSQKFDRGEVLFSDGVNGHGQDIGGGPIYVTANGTATQTWTPSVPGKHDIEASFVDITNVFSQSNAYMTVDVTTGINLGLACLVAPF